MSDQVVGTSILDSTATVHKLYLWAQPEGKDPMISAIPCYPAGSPKPGNDINNGHSWEYRINGDTLDITPSLHMVGHFHNGYNWSVKFKHAELVESKDHRSTQCYNQLRAENPTFKG